MDQTLAQGIIRKASLRLIPFLCLLYLANFIDRINVSFAALTMNKSIGLSASTYGLGAGIFFSGYLCLQIPSTLALARVGARRWIACIMIAWGIVTAATALITGPNTFFGARFLLGIAEAGFFPGVLYYLTQWFPSAHRAKMVGMFMVGMPLSGFVGAPISTYFLTALDGYAGLAGWRWMFIVEGIPVVLMGVACLWMLSDRPSEARWLTQSEQRLLQDTLDEEKRARESVKKYTVMQALTTPRVLFLALMQFCISSGAYGTLFWIPQLVKEFGLSNQQVGFLTAVPYLFAVLAMVLWSRHSDAKSERIWHVALATFVSALGFLISAIWLHVPIVATAGLCLALIGIYGAYPVIWTLPTAFLTGPAAAGAIALIVATGNLSGVVAPAVIGRLKDATGSFSLAMVLLCGELLLAGIIVRLSAPKKTAAADMKPEGKAAMGGNR